MKLIMVRHGQSQWNLENRFTGWYDVDLTEAGILEAQQAGRLIREAGLGLDIAFTSVLTRANKTLYHLLNQTDSAWIPIYKSWRLNERHYGGLTGKNKQEMREIYGEDQVHIWRRSYDICPPEMDANQAKALYQDSRYHDLSPSARPLTESLELTLDRVRPYWIDHILPSLYQGKNVLVVAHGNSLRALSMIIEDISPDRIESLEIRTGVPILYEWDDKFRILNKILLERDSADTP